MVHTLYFIDMEPNTTTGSVASRSLAALGVMIVLLLLSAVMPASWFGVKPKAYTKLDLNDLTPTSRLAGEGGGLVEDAWREAAIDSLGTSTKELVKTTKIDPAAQKRLLDPNNLTASFSKNLFAASAYLKQNGTDGVNQEDLIKTLMNEEAKKITLKVYTTSDIKINNNATMSDKKAYGNALGSILKKAETYKLGEGEAEALNDYLTKKDPALLLTFITKRANTDKLIQEMLSINVPLSAVPYHLLALNRASEYRTMIDGFSTADNDPVRASIAFNGYIPTIKALAGALGNLSSYFGSENIVFTKNDAGYRFTTGYTNQ